MSQVDDLLKQLSPGGVPIVPLEEVATIFAGLSGKTKADFSDGNARFVSYRNIYENTEVDQKADDFVRVESGERQRQLQRGDVLFTGSSENVDDVGMSSVVVDEPEEPLYLNSFCFAVRFDEPNRMLPSFSKYLFRSERVRSQIRRTASGVTRINVSKSRFLRVLIPMPPIGVQREIVRILDSFADLEKGLQIELEAELKARKLQYAYYRDSLFPGVDSGDTEWLPLNDVAAVFDGTHQTPSYTDAGIKFVSVENIRSLYDSAKYISEDDFRRLYKTKPRRDDVLMTRIGSVGACAVVDRDEPLAYYVSLALIRPNSDRVNSRYLKHLLESGVGAKELRKRTLVNAVPVKINLGDIGKVRLPFPALEDQELIAATLDGLGGLVANLSAALPLERRVRRQQYEHYRDRLLTFEAAIV